MLRLAAMGCGGLGAYGLVALALGVTPLKEFITRKGNANDGRRTADHHRFREEDEQMELSLRPRTLAEYFGQEKLKRA